MNICEFLKKAAERAGVECPDDYESWCFKERQHIALERADETRLSEALAIYRANPACALFHIKMTTYFAWKLPKDPAWRAEFPDAAAFFDSVPANEGESES